MADPGEPTLDEIAAILDQVGVPLTVRSLPPDRGSAGRLHVYVFDEVVVKCDQSSDGRRSLRERCALELLDGAGLPVPRLLGAGSWRSDQGWVALSRLDGTVPPDALLLAHEPSESVARSMGHLSARLHAGPTPPGFGTWARGPFSLREDHETGTAAVLRMAEGSDLISALELKQLASELARLRESLISAPRTPVLVHRDVQPRNLLVDEAGEVCALLDFETAAGGDPAEDFSPIGLDWSNSSFVAFCDGYAGAGGRLEPMRPHGSRTGCSGGRWSSSPTSVTLPPPIWSRRALPGRGSRRGRYPTWARSSHS